MLIDSGVTWTLTGHSERRVGFGYPGETSHVLYIVAYISPLNLAKMNIHKYLGCSS